MNDKQTSKGQSDEVQKLQVGLHDKKTFTKESFFKIQRLPINEFKQAVLTNMITDKAGMLYCKNQVGSEEYEKYYV